ncbi:MAG: beta-lactamase family protein [Acidobacteriota bacterium]|nr:beta-lactamase family protein [Acidobacteriota bacterium]
MTSEDRAAAVLEAAVNDRAFPGAVAEMGSVSGALWHHAAGRLTYEPASPRTRTETIYDLASLTKVVSTTSLAMRLAQRGALDIDDAASSWFPEWREGPFQDVRVRDLLEHSAGLAAWLPLFREHTGRGEFRSAIAALAPDYPPRSKSVYSDLGFLLLGHVVESAGGRPLDEMFETLKGDASLPTELAYAAAGSEIAPTEFDPWRGRLPVGEVHDENAAALGGVAPHAGLFGTASSVGSFARLVLRTFEEDTALGTPALMARFATRSTVPGSSRALGWDTMLPSSSCGERMSGGAIGHTGFTGTSLWIDRTRDRYYVLLSNRVHPTRDNNTIRQVRRDFHDAWAY